MLTTLLLSLTVAAAEPPSWPLPWETRVLPASPSARPKCIKPNPILAQRQGERARARRFAEPQTGRLELAVVREIDRCPIPAVLREGVGRR